MARQGAGRAHPYESDRQGPAWLAAQDPPRIARALPPSERCVARWDPLTRTLVAGNSVPSADQAGYPTGFDPMHDWLLTSGEGTLVMSDLACPVFYSNGKVYVCATVCTVACTIRMCHAYFLKLLQYSVLVSYCK